MQGENPLWYCVRTKPKHEHIALANIRKQCGLRGFLPQLLVERSTRRGMVRIVEPLFPCYLFVHCEIGRHFDQIRYSNGVGTIVHFGKRLPPVPDSVILELAAFFPSDEPMHVDGQLEPGTRVILSGGAFDGMSASVLKVMPARQRVQVLLEILGRATAVEVDRNSVVPERNSIAEMVPSLASAHPYWVPPQS